MSENEANPTSPPILLEYRSSKARPPSREYDVAAILRGIGVVGSLVILAVILALEHAHVLQGTGVLACAIPLIACTIYCLFRFRRNIKPGFLLGVLISLVGVVFIFALLGAFVLLVN